MSSAPRPSTPPTTRPMPSRRSLLLLLGSLSAFGALSIDMYLPAFGVIARDFGTDEAHVERTLTAFFIGLSFGQLLYGSVTDRYGRRPPLFAGLILYGLMSLGCAFSTSLTALMVFRFFQALGACGGIVVARAVVRDLFEEREAARVFSLLMLVLGVAPILAPLAGGYLATRLDWRAIFWVHALFGIGCFLGTLYVLPETRRPHANAAANAPEPGTEVTLARTFVAVLSNRRYLGYALSGGLAQAGMFAYITGSPFVLMNLFHVRPEHYGWVFGANGLGLVLASQWNARLLSRHSIDAVLGVVTALIAACALYLVAAGMLGLGMYLVVPGLFVYVSLLGLTSPNTAARALSAQRAHIGTAAAVLGSLQFALAFIGSLLVSHLHDGTARPMTATMGVCGVGSLLVYRLLARKTESPPPVATPPVANR